MKRNMVWSSIVAAASAGCGPEPFPNDLCEWLEAEASEECADPSRCIRVGCTPSTALAEAGGLCEFVHETAITTLDTLEEAGDWCRSLRRGQWGSGPSCGVPIGDTDAEPIQAIVACHQFWPR